MGFIPAVKAVLARIAANIIATINRLSTQDVVVSREGEIFIREPAIAWLSDRLSALVLGAAALFFLLSPVHGARAMTIGDQLLRAAVFLWAGSEPVPS